MRGELIHGRVEVVVPAVLVDVVVRQAGFAERRVGPLVVGDAVEALGPLKRHL